MKRVLLATTTLAALASPALANKFVDQDNGALPFSERFEMRRTSAMHEPTFKTDRRCSLAHECATVEFAVVEEGKNGKVGEFFIYPDKSPQDVIMCSTYPDHSDLRSCSKAGSEAGTTAIWIEAYFPRAGEFREIPYGEGFTDPDCKALQQLEYDIDPAYADCVVRKLDAAPPSPSLGALDPRNVEAVRRQSDPRRAASYRFAVLTSGHVCDKADEVHDPDTAPDALPGHARLFCDHGAHVYVLKHHGVQWQYSSTAANR